MVLNQESSSRAMGSDQGMPCAWSCCRARHAPIDLRTWVQHSGTCCRTFKEVSQTRLSTGTCTCTGHTPPHPCRYRCLCPKAITSHKFVTHRFLLGQDEDGWASERPASGASQLELQALAPACLAPPPGAALASSSYKEPTRLEEGPPAGRCCFPSAGVWCCMGGRFSALEYSFRGLPLWGSRPLQPQGSSSCQACCSRGRPGSPSGFCIHGLD